MKKLLFIALILFTGNALASSLPNCPSDQSKRYHNCFGTYTLADGEKYVGEWRDDKLNGQGTYSWTDGEKYVGEWKDNKRRGQGTNTFADGTEQRGYYMNDEYVPTICENMGLKKGSDPFGQCVVELIKQIRDDD